MREIRYVCSAAIILVSALSAMGQRAPHEMGAIPPQADWNDRQVDNVSPVAGVDLYVKDGFRKQTPVDTRTDEEKTFAATYPELAKTEGAILVFTAEWCGWCKHQARALSIPSKSYYVILCPVEDENGGPTKYHDLVKVWGENPNQIPLTVIIEGGKPVKFFYGYKEWSAIKPFAEKAKRNNEKDDPKSPNHVNIGPLRIDWDNGVDIDWERRQWRNRQKR